MFGEVVIDTIVQNHENKVNGDSLFRWDNSEINRFLSTKITIYLSNAKRSRNDSYFV